MSAEQQLIYECSRKTADKQVSNSEWINIWRDGIQLNRGDTVRLLGSFISEDGDSSDIQVLDKSSFTIEHMPYINVDTVRFEDSVAGTKSHPAQYQMRFGDIGSPAYSTSAYGEEPPYHALQAAPREQLLDGTPNTEHDFAIQLREPVATNMMDWYSDTGWYDMYKFAWDNDNASLTGIAYHKGYDFAVNDYAQKLGCYFETGNEFIQPKAPTTISTNDSPAKTYLVPTPTEDTLSEFTLKNLEHQYHIAHMCKLVYFPVFQGVYYESTDNVFTTKDFADDDLLQVGDYISTYFISGAANHGGGDYIYDAGTTFGQPQWDSGPRSVVGKIMATKKAFVQVPDPLTGFTVSMEMLGCYVYEFVNPGSYKNTNTVTSRPRHGSALQDNGYNLNRNDNRNAGVSYQAYPMNAGGGVAEPSAGPSSDIAYPYRNSYLPKNYEVQKVGQEVYKQTGCPLNTGQTQNENMNLETNTSLSFLWSCRGTDMRPLAPDPPSVTDGGQTHATSWIRPEIVLGPVQNITIYSSFAIGSTIVDIYNPTNKIKTESQLVFAGGNATIKEIYNFPGYTRLYTYAPTTEGRNVGDVMTYAPNIRGNYWYPRQYAVEIRDYDKAHREWYYQRQDAVNYNNWGAIVKTNPDDDNIQSYTPEVGKYHRLYIPFTQQTVAPLYKARNFGAGDSFAISTSTTAGSGNNTVSIGGAHNYAIQPSGFPNDTTHTRLRQNFGICCGRGSGIAGNSINTNVASKPVPYGLVATDGWNHSYIGSGGGNYLNQDQGNSYNDSVCSIHFQRPLDGSQEFKQGDSQAAMEARVWQEDLLYIKKYKTEFKPKPGYYNYQQVADDINRQLHFNFQDYQKNVGINTTVGLRQRARGVAPNVINGNFVHTYLPDITYGFMPLTQYVYEANIPKWNENGITNYRTQHANDFLNSSTPTNDVANVNISTYDDSINLYLPPTTHTSGGVPLADDGSLQLFKLNGAKLISESNTLSMDHQDPQAMMTNRTVDILNTMTYLGVGQTDMRKFRAGANYQTRTAFNNFMYGGCAKIFVGAVNPSFEIDPDISRMIFKFLYTPYRPATDDTGTPLSLVSGQAVPSAIIDSFGNGGITDSLSGVYFKDLIASQIDQIYSPLDFLGYTNISQYPVPDSLYVEKATTFWNSLGFTDTQLDQYRSSTSSVPFTFYSRDFQVGDILFNIPETDISVNASNPFYSYCSLWLPPLQFSVEVDSNEIIANRQPLTQNSPFYLIGSDFPGKHYYGNKGTKLPVMGVCSRQFTSFGFAFDLSESAIQWTIEEDVFLTSIHTKIYNNDMSIPLNLDDNSSIIYAITKAQYYKQPSQEDLQNTEQLMLENTEPPIQYTAPMFVYPNQLNYEAPLFYDEDSDYDE